jgi:hypothetical protein
MRVLSHVLALAGAACAVALLASGPALAASCNFESGLGKNGQAIGTSEPGFTFTTSTGGSMRYADINSGWYSVTSDNGKVYEDGEYFLSGDVGAYCNNLADQGKVSFTSGLVDFFSVGYSSQYDFVMEAYDASGGLLTSVTGAANTKSQDGTGLSYLSVNHTGISYVVFHDHGGYWMIDNASTDVPEPASMSVLCLGLAGLLWRRRK